jgi:molecular chaperone GrpE
MQDNEQTQDTAASPQPAAGDSNQDETQLEQKLAAEQQKAEEYLDLLRHTQADFINYRRRINQELDEVRTTAQIDVLQQFLPVLDDLGRALEAAPPDLVGHPWVQGLFLVAKRLTATLNQLGIQQIGKAGEAFNPHIHEAVAAEARSGGTPGTVLEVVRPGYTYRERVVRPAQVVVSDQNE